MIRISINRKLYLRLTIGITLLWVLSVVGVTSILKYETEEIFNSSLQETAERLLVLTAEEIDNGIVQSANHAAGALEHDEYLMYQVFDRNGQLVRRSHQAPESAFPVPHKQGFYSFDGQHFYVGQTRDQQYSIVLSERRLHRQHTLLGLLKYLVLPLLLIWPISIWVMNLSTRHAGRLVERFESDLKRRQGFPLSPIDISDYPDELLGLARSVNNLIDRLNRATLQEKKFTQNCAHELRTPIAVAITQLEVLKDECQHQEDCARTNSALSVLRRLQRTTVKLLQLSRIDSGAALNSADVDLGGLVDLLLKEARFKSRRVFEYVAPPSKVLVRGDIDMLGIAIQNVLENSEQHASQDSSVKVMLDERGVLTVQNDAPAIPQDRLEALRARFVRMNNSRAGAGLGLSIVDEIMSQSGGKMDFRSPCFDNGRGFEVRLVLRSANLMNHYVLTDFLAFSGDRDGQAASGR